MNERTGAAVQVHFPCSCLVPFPPFYLAHARSPSRELELAPSVYRHVRVCVHATKAALCRSGGLLRSYLQVVDDAILVTDRMFKRLKRKSTAVKRQPLKFRLEAFGCLLPAKVLCPLLVGDV